MSNPADPRLNRQRVMDHGEVFTPPALVNTMLELVAAECERIDSRFLEPACGNGNFLAEVLRRKLHSVTKHAGRSPPHWERDAVIAMSSLYGIDLLADNVAECRQRLLGLVAEAHVQATREALPDAVALSLAFILERNIVQGDAVSLQNAVGQPIVFCEWSPLPGGMLKRRDFVFEHLLEHAHVANLPLFNDLGKDVFVPTPVGDHPPCHYLRIPAMETAK